MNKQTARSLLMDFLYDEISEPDEKKLIIYLDNHPEMKEELNELRKTQKLLQQAPPVEKSASLRIVEPRSRSFSGWLRDAKMLLPKTGWGKTALAAAACILLLLVIGSLARVQISSSRTG